MDVTVSTEAVTRARRMYHEALVAKGCDLNDIRVKLHRVFGRIETTAHMVDDLNQFSRMLSDIIIQNLVLNTPTSEREHDNITAVCLIILALREMKVPQFGEGNLVSLDI